MHNTYEMPIVSMSISPSYIHPLLAIILSQGLKYLHIQLFEWCTPAQKTKYFLVFFQHSIKIISLLICEIMKCNICNLLTFWKNAFTKLAFQRQIIGNTIILFVDWKCPLVLVSWPSPFAFINIFSLILVRLNQHFSLAMDKTLFIKWASEQVYFLSNKVQDPKY